MVQHDLQTIKDKTRLLESGSGSGGTVGGGVSAAVWERTTWHLRKDPLPELGVRLNDFFMPRKMEFKGWVTDYKQCSYQGLTETEVSDFIKDQMVPDPFIKYVDWEQTKTEQGAWLTRTMVNMWFSNEANFPSMVRLLDIIKEALKKDPTNRVVK